MTSAALSRHAQIARHLLPASVFHLGHVRVGPSPRDDGTSNPTVGAGRDLPMSSPSDLLHRLTVESRCSFSSEDEYFFLDVVRATEIDRAVRQLRVASVFVALVPLSCLCVVAGIWTSISPSLMVSDANISTNSSTFCCVFQSPSKPPDDCIISSYVDVACVQCVDSNMLAGEQRTETWTNVSSYVGCNTILFTLDDRFNCGCGCIANVSCCLVAYCNTSGNSSLLSQSSFINALYSGQTQLSTTWIVSGLTMLGAVSVVAVAFLVLAMRRFQRGKLRRATEEAREARTRRRTAAVEQCRCDRLLLDMLPASVAVSLKMGQTVDPETFDVASVYFSDIVGFNDVALSCETPLVVVRLLNQVFRYSPTHCVTDVKYHITFNCQYENMNHE